MPFAGCLPELICLAIQYALISKLKPTAVHLSRASALSYSISSTWLLEQSGKIEMAHRGSLLAFTVNGVHCTSMNWYRALLGTRITA